MASDWFGFEGSVVPCISSSDGRLEGVLEDEAEEESDSASFGRFANAIRAVS
jgi:hypothetical protein